LDFKEIGIFFDNVYLGLDFFKELTKNKKNLNEEVEL
jgi:hypothetical protein